MPSRPPPGQDDRRALALHTAFLAGDWAAVKLALGDPAFLPTDPLPAGFGSCLTYAIYHSPLGIIEELLRLGANPALDDGEGYPPLHAALASAREIAGQASRSDWAKILDLLLRQGADPNQRGLNDFTPLHLAVALQNEEAIRQLLKAGADPGLATRIDECETPGQMAERLGHKNLAALLKG